MTIEECTRKLRRLQALERLTWAIQLNLRALDPDWPYGVEAMGWEILALRYQLAREAPELIQQAEALIAQERPAAAVTRHDAPRSSLPRVAGRGPTTSRIH